MARLKDMYCCGLKELTGISYLRGTAEQRLNAMLSQASFTGRFCEVIFTWAGSRRPTTNRTYGRMLANIIRDKNLGTVTAINPVRNPNSGNYVETFIWTLDRPAIADYMTRNNITQDPRYRSGFWND